MNGHGHDTDAHDRSTARAEPRASHAAERSHGSTEDFEADWAKALATRDPRWLIYPDASGEDQISLVEWVKARQVMALLHARGIGRGRVLEYGCGTAGMSVYLKEQGFETCAADLSLNALRMARMNDRRHRSSARPLRVMAANALSLPLSDDSFDVVMSYGLLEHFDEEAVRTLLGEVTRVLKPGGVFIADIVPARWNARALGTAVNFLASSAYHALRGKWSVLASLRQRYFGHYFETSFGPEVWERLLLDTGLQNVQVRVCRPFPPLAISGLMERQYVKLMRASLPLWLKFDRSGGRVARRWGWMYLASGTKPGMTAA